MESTGQHQVCIALAFGLLSAASMASDHSTSGEACVGFGPQTPRDIDNPAGENARLFSLAPSYKEMNLCNIHFHNNAEHKARDFSIYAGEGDHGHGGGYKCVNSRSLSAAELTAPGKNHCKGVKPGVRPRCAKLDINSLSEWCKRNVFEEDHAHGVRKLVTNPKLLSKIR